MKTENFIKKINEVKDKDMLDLSVGEDLSIALMNLISLEEHFAFSFMKTSQATYLELLEQVRELRKRLLRRIVKENEGENWCISKHLLAASMRLIEVGSKYLHESKKEDAREAYIEAFNIYSLFWAVNGVGEVEKYVVTEKKLSRLSMLIRKIVDCCKE